MIHFFSQFSLVQIPNALNLSDITSSILTVAMFGVSRRRM